MSDRTKSISSADVTPALASDAAPQYSKLRWGIALLLMMSTMVSYLDRQTLAIAGPEIVKQYHMTNEEFGLLTTAFLVAYGLMHPVMGRLIDWLGTRTGLALAVVWWSLSNIAHALAGGVVSFSVFRASLGMGEAGNFPGAIKAVSEWFVPKERAVATGILNMGAGIGAIIAAPLVAWITLKYGWKEAFIVTGSTGFIWLIFWLALYPSRRRIAASSNLMPAAPEESDDVPEPVRRDVWKEVLSRRDLWVLMLARLISDPGWWFYLVWLPKYLSDVRGFSLKDIGLFAWIPYLGADFGSLAGGALSAWFIRRNFSVLSARKAAMCICAAMMPVAIPAVMSKTPYMALVFITIATTAHQAWAASLLTLPADLFHKRAVASAYGFTGLMGNLGAALFMWLVGTIIDRVGYTPVFLYVGFLHPLAALIVLLFVRGTRPPQRGFPVLDPALDG